MVHDKATHKGEFTCFFTFLEILHTIIAILFQLFVFNFKKNGDSSIRKGKNGDILIFVEQNDTSSYFELLLKMKETASQQKVPQQFKFTLIWILILLHNFQILLEKISTVCHTIF